MLQVCKDRNDHGGNLFTQFSLAKYLLDTHSVLCTCTWEGYEDKVQSPPLYNSQSCVCRGRSKYIKYL